MHPLKWTVVAAILAAAEIAVGFVAGTSAFDAAAASGNAVGSATFSSVADKLTTSAIIFPEVNRGAKGDRLRVLNPVDQGADAFEQAKNDWSNRSGQKRAPGEEGRKPLAHCELVASPLAHPVILQIPQRRCLADLGQYTVVNFVALRASAVA